MGRSRGGQPGNTNALKHGFYSRFFNQGEVDDIQSISADLTDEIAMLRVITRRLFDRISQLEQSAPENFNQDTYTALVALASSSTIRLASLLRTNHFLTGKGTDLGEALKAALSETIEEMNLK